MSAAAADAFDLRGKVALVTGSTRGIGFAIAQLGRLGEPADVAGAMVFLASRAGAFVTGQTIVIDGGATAGGFD